MKNILTLLMVITFSFSLLGCNEEKKNNPTAKEIAKEVVEAFKENEKEQKKKEKLSTPSEIHRLPKDLFEFN